MQVLVFGFLRKEGTLTRQSVMGVESAAWGLEVELLTVLNEQIAGLIYGLSGGKGSKPKPIKRPFKRDGGHHFGFDPVPASEFNTWWENN